MMLHSFSGSSLRPVHCACRGLPLSDASFGISCSTVEVLGQTSSRTRRAKLSAADLEVLEDQKSKEVGDFKEDEPHQKNDEKHE